MAIATASGLVYSEKKSGFKNKIIFRSEGCKKFGQERELCKVTDRDAVLRTTADAENFVLRR